MGLTKLPVPCQQTDLQNAFDKRTEHGCGTTPKLEPRQALRAHIVGEYLHHVHVCERIVPQTVCWAVEEDEDQHCVSSFHRSCDTVTSLRYSPASVYKQQAGCAEQVHAPARVSRRDGSEDDADDETPRFLANIVAYLLPSIRDAYHA